MTRKKSEEAEDRSETKTDPGIPPEPVKEAAAPPPTPAPAWVANAKMLCPRASDGNGAWHDFFKEALPSAPKEQWVGPNAIHSYYEGGRILVSYPNGFFAVMTSPPEKPVRPGPQARR